MQLTGNTIFITGGGSGIGRGLAEALHAKGNQVVISGRRANLLKEVTGANPGMDFIELNVEDPKSITSVAETLIAKYPKLNVIINNAGMMKYDTAGEEIADDLLVSTLTTNVMGPIRLTSALLAHMKQQPTAYVAYTTSGLAFVPMAPAAIYSATKAFLHSYILSQRYLLKDTTVKVLEIAPPYVQTELTGPDMATDPRAMPLKDFIEQTIEALGTDAEEVLVPNVMQLRNGAGVKDYEATVGLNNFFAGH